MCVGKIKEDYIQKGIDYFNKGIEIIEIPDEPISDKVSNKEIEKIKDIEGDKILGKIAKDDVVVALAIMGKEVCESEFARYKKDNTVFVIGGSLGLSDRVLSRSNYKISFGKMTFKHQQIRLVLMEKLSKKYEKEHL
ncbi:MAG: 23S rRNA (pseudouridine(1915)-N(3))-methyltransferase RlmH [Lachnospirales bacterium]